MRNILAVLAMLSVLAACEQSSPEDEQILANGMVSSISSLSSSESSAESVVSPDSSSAESEGVASSVASVVSASSQVVASSSVISSSSDSVIIVEPPASSADNTQSSQAPISSVPAAVNSSSVASVSSAATEVSSQSSQATESSVSSQEANESSLSSASETSSSSEASSSSESSASSLSSQSSISSETGESSSEQSTSSSVAISGSWQHCADEWQTCEFTGTMVVRYGTTDAFFTESFTDGVTCTNSNFGDPAPNTAKHCYIFIAEQGGDSSLALNSSSLSVQSSSSVSSEVSSNASVSSSAESSSSSLVSSVSSSSVTAVSSSEAATSSELSSSSVASQSSSSEAASSSSSSSDDVDHIFVATGHFGRTMMSCDGGKTWPAAYDKSDNDTARCGNGVDCAHASNAGMNVIPALDGFYAAFGWGGPGTVRRSYDGANWEIIEDQLDHNFIAYGNGVFMLGQERPQRSLDFGETWISMGNTLSQTNARRSYFVPHGDGYFFSLHSSGDSSLHQQRMMDANAAAQATLPDDAWREPNSFPESCLGASYTYGMVYGNSTVVFAGNRANGVCYSQDGGDNFTYVDLGMELNNPPVWSGDKFWVFARGMTASSEDGVDWEVIPMNESQLSLGLVQAGGGDFVGVVQGWNTYYEKQKFYHSPDGVNWTELPSGSYQGGHPLRSIAYGPVLKENSVCD